MRTLNKVLTAATAVAALGGTVLATASPAMAAGRNGVCDNGEFCLYYNSGQKGSVSDFTGSVADYGAKQPGCYDFKGAGAGKGKCVKNAAASVWNRTGKTVRVYFNSNYGGKYQDFKAGTKGNLNSGLKNQNASHAVGPTNRVNMSWALYKTGGGHISCPFDGYTTTPGRHEGTDIARGIGSDVHALTSGKVIYIARGYNGRSGLSTISIYNATLKKTVIYLHSAPRSGLRVGQNVSRGQIIADEAWHGVSTAGAAHTHVEMRLGYQKLAAKSVGDPRLDNPNPISFWLSQGYNYR
ncbi:peptidase inhibitor family I36 protein [Actinomadura rupiterrae]|uniref:peptidase inhibitor family I36 protein n=1 Tax=Actinomadura rupiterrae TaxID=559627 RepID=UPI0020A29EC8|nr:peptidase inhibitor family I36 protein [Actinomadura rupiterrae]MCP2337981.1 murein DD-endopeptidase MepM/ murein hydrolase activator NlpD [Actinomadura rupiterrae]